VKALITGVTGFVGSYLAEHLVSCGDDVIGCSYNGHWGSDIPRHVSERVPVFPWDMSRGLPDDVAGHVAEFSPDVIYHLAAISVPAECGADQPTLRAICTNVDGTRAVIALANFIPKHPRIVMAGSCYVYGPVSPDNPVVNEDFPCWPVHGYGITKLAAERELIHASREQGIDVVIARAFQHSGPRQSAQMVLPDWAQQLTTGKRPVRAICLDTFLDISDVRDVVRAYRNLCVSGRSQMVYNVGSGISRRAGDLLDWMLQAYSLSGCLIELSPGRRQHPIADITRIHSETGWQPIISIETTLNDILAYWQAKETAT
jgi:GDP-4-dehydro-6-deoxy-D-mannose reductase